MTMKAWKPSFKVIGPARFTAMPLIKLSKYWWRCWSGMMA